MRKDKLASHTASKHPRCVTRIKNDDLDIGQLFKKSEKGSTDDPVPLPGPSSEVQRIEISEVQVEEVNLIPNIYNCL